MLKGVGSYRRRVNRIMNLSVQRQISRWCRTSSIFVAVAFFLANTVIFIRLVSFAGSCHDTTSQTTKKLLLKSLPAPDRVFQADFRLGRWDSSRQYKMFDNILVGKNFIQLSENSRVTLATQTDPHHLHHVLEMASHWGGPISVALYAAGEEDRIALESQLRFLRRCFDNLASRMSFHLALPVNTPEGKWNTAKLEKSLNEIQQDLDCRLFDKALKKIESFKESGEVSTRDQPHVYPQNHLRNLSRKNCQTPFVFLTDVDIVPCFKLWEQLDKFLPKVSKSDRHNNESDELKVAYVVPTYEVDSKASFPKSKKEMIQLAEQGLARPFHQKIWSLNQWFNNFSRWQKEHDSDNDLRAAYKVSKPRFGYEPFYVALDTVPQHDERFLGYGFTRNSQVFEMAAAGFQFSVLSPAFAVHWGFQTLKTRPKWRGRQSYENSLKFNTFKAEVAARYNAVFTSKTVNQTRKAKNKTGTV